jgi:NAD(P)-dependent dehydrogenase (short-subunit alcohol dehydrogenase family)
VSLTRPGRLGGHTVLVAGASRGIGAAVAIACAREGARRVALLGRAEADLDRVAGAVRAAGAQADTIVCDLTDRDERSSALDRAGEVDVLVYSAGINRPQPFLDVDEGTYDLLFELNVRSGYFVAQSVARRMQRAARPGCIVFVSSQMGHVGAPDRTVYCATKHAVEGMVKAIALELAPAGVRVVSVAPTFVRTDMTAEQLDDPTLGTQLLEQIPLGRFATVDDVAAAVVWAASPDAAMLTGTSLVIDGGWTAR